MLFNLNNERQKIVTIVSQWMNIERLVNLFNSITVKVKNAPQVQLHSRIFGVHRFCAVDKMHYNMFIQIDYVIRTANFS